MSRTATNTALATMAPADRIAVQLETRLPKFLEVAPPTLGEKGVRRLIRQASIAVTKSPELGKCNPGSIALAVLQAVELGLDLASARPMAWIIPFKGEAKLMLGYQGLAEIAYRDGAVKLIQARVVYDNDDFEIDYGNVAKPFSHRPTLDEEPGEVIGAYAVADITASQWPAFEWVDETQIEKIRRSSRGGNSGPWRDWYDEMAKKSAVRRIIKLLPTCPPKLGRALEIDRESDGLIDDAPALPARPSNTARIKAATGHGEHEHTPTDGPTLDTRDASDPPAPPHTAATPLTEAVEIAPEDIPF